MAREVTGLMALPKTSRMDIPDIFYQQDLFSCMEIPMDAAGWERADVRLPQTLPGFTNANADGL
ncbi:hypothetical protein PAL_GLEAN10015829 [Pteropus alecto]|uniref:Uncharacterized protein n=1 Tax=Pteropus alecto TaxID=9402 RepID=L5L1P8_PTEAL|nr:hypothetical protein PAL_GLEAN10015829 [Pteropus alecto]